MRKQILKISDVYFDNKIYPRENFSKVVVKQYIQDMKFGSIFPPIHVTKFKGKFYLIDGLHRLKAKEELGEEYINADVQDNLTNELDIYLASIRANLSHGKTLIKKDRLKIAKQLRNMKVEFDDITKLLHVSNKDLEKIGITTVSDLKKIKIGSRDLMSSLRNRKTKNKYKFDSKITEDIRHKQVEVISKEEEQYGELNAFLWFLKNVKLINNPDNKLKLIAINKEITKLLKKMK
jgi:ParB-like chromosome segregation protein Spo0J